jgi:hypothetical protein
MKESAQYAYAAKQLIESIDAEGRDRTPEEAGRIEELLAKSRQAREGGRGPRGRGEGPPAVGPP